MLSLYKDNLYVPQIMSSKGGGVVSGSQKTVQIRRRGASRTCSPALQAAPTGKLTNGRKVRCIAPPTAIHKTAHFTRVQLSVNGSPCVSSKDFRLWESLHYAHEPVDLVLLVVVFLHLCETFYARAHGVSYPNPQRDQRHEQIARAPP